MGNPGLGKTLYTCNLAARVTTGDLGPPRSVLMLTAEDSLAAVLRPRLEAAGADLDLVHFLVVRRDGIDGSLSLPDDVGALGEKVREHDAALVTVDPLMAHLPESVNSYRDQSIRGALAPLPPPRGGHSLRRSCGRAPEQGPGLGRDVSNRGLNRHRSRCPAPAW